MADDPSGRVPTITVDVGKLQALVRVLNDGPRRLGQAVRVFLTQAVRRAERSAVKLVSAPGGYRNKVEGKIHARSGRLRNLIASRVVVTGGSAASLVIEAGVGLYKASGGQVPAYAWVHEFGLTQDIVPKAGRKLLTIPWDEALTPAGVPRFTARQVIEGDTEYRTGFWEQPGLDEPEGPVILFGVEADDEIVPLFTGVRRVRKESMPGIRFLGRPIEQEEMRFRGELQQWWVDQMLEERPTFPTTGGTGE